ncbi:hypothetical protein F2P81_002488 [Scophthalmus maximus]|uniref:Uncharacterized protein n=1 Tax=Scophthalmus maximus TaxID=52904 RepID=A0A6A4TM96_SCOMX|nr:hypothetical protein F2P81_002488 [Scophthalmus maximus]
MGNRTTYLGHLKPNANDSYSRVTGGSGSTDEVSLSEQLLQVIDDLIRMLPAAQRLTLKDFPYVMAQTATEARATRFTPDRAS